MDLIAGVGSMGALIFLVLLVLLGILLPFSAYAAQKWANRTYKETRKINAKLEQMLIIMQNEADARTTVSSRESQDRGHKLSV